MIIIKLKIDKNIKLTDNHLKNKLLNFKTIFINYIKLYLINYLKMFALKTDIKL